MINCIRHFKRAQFVIKDQISQIAINCKKCLSLDSVNRFPLKFYSRYNSFQTRTMSDIPSLKSKFVEQKVQIQTCGELYRKWKEEKNWNVPSGDLLFDVSYIDTGDKSTEPNNSFSSPIVLALHGAPGSYEDFNLLASHLHQQGVRVIAPNLPSFAEYRPGIFRHSAEERAQFVKDFLKSINVSKLDLLVCHSSTVYAGLILCVENEAPEIKSLALLNPGTFDDTMWALNRKWILYFIVYTCENPIGFQILKLFGNLLLKASKTPVRVTNVLDPLLSANVMLYADFPKRKENLSQLLSRDFPIFLAFSENDRLIQKELSYDMSHFLGAQDEDIYYFDKDGVLKHTGIEKPFLKVMAFEKGSHYVFWKHPEIIHEAISEFLTKVNRAKL